MFITKKKTYNKYGDFMNIRTDFADEILIKKNKEYKKNINNYKYVKQTNIEILKDNNSFNKEKGKYVSLDFNNLYDDEVRKEISEVLIESLSNLYKVNENDKILIVGLGNEIIIANSLGPMVADKIIVTNHWFKLYPNDVNDDFNKVCVFTPKVMGQTGLESADLVKGVVDLFKPNLIIIIDALASSSINRVNKVIQLSDTGIAPGSGVGNYRKEINERSMKCKVVAIGVATVVEANKIISELDERIKIPKNSNYNLILTPKEIDEDIEHLSTIIATSINKYVHDDYSNL